MTLKKLLLGIFAFTFSVSCQTTPEVDYTQWVNPLMGTESTFAFSHGNTYPAVAVPWGMNFWTPQTGENGSGWTYGYHEKAIRGFRQTHQPSPWINDYATFSLMPWVGDVKLSHTERLATFSHENEVAKPDFYSVKFDNGIRTTFSPTSRGAVFEVEYPAEEAQWLIVDGYKGGCQLELDVEKGILKGVTKYNNGGVPENFANYYIMEFSHPIIGHEAWNGKEKVEGTTTLAGDEGVMGLRFAVPDGERLTVRVASSFISEAQAELNFQNEVKGLSQKEIQQKANSLWNEYLGRIAVEDNNEENLKTFYSCLYRVLLFPRELHELNAEGQPIYYSPYDGNVHEGYMYTDNGFWDTFRAVHPLFGLVYPELTERITSSLLAAYDEGGYMPEWASPGYRDCMIGNNSVSLMTDAWMKGIRKVDAKKALEAMIHQTTTRHPKFTTVGRDGVEWYDELGYVPYPEVGEATAKTLEYAYADWCVARFAEAIGEEEIAQKFYLKSQNYHNLYYPEEGFMWAKNAKGEWREKFDATEWGGPFTEGCTWHWTWCVFHDVEGLAKLMGGHEKMAQKLDEMFSSPNTFNYGTYGFVIHEIAEMVALNMGQYAHGNQPVQHAIYLYNYAGQPWKAQYHLRDVMSKLYNSGSKGYCGDEDNGQTSAWYVFTAMGFYPVCPGSNEYVMGSPLFDKVTISLPKGREFTISAPQAGERVYIDSASLNGEVFTRNYLTHEELTRGGSLDFVMSTEPNIERGTQPEDMPYSYSK